MVVTILRIYLAGPIFTPPHIRANLELTAALRSRRFSVYCPNENGSINDKAQDSLTGERIYDTDVTELLGSNLLLCCGMDDPGAMWEAGFMDCLSKVDPDRYLGSLALVEDIRLSTPPNPEKSGFDNQTFYLNQFVVGGFKRSLGICLGTDKLFDRLETIRDTAR